MSKRSFSEKVTGSDAFAELSFEAQALYFQLSMSADDEGFVSAPKKVQRSIGASIAALDELESSGYLVFFDTGACVIAHWNQNNHINEKRKKATDHSDELSRLFLDDDGVYHEIEENEEYISAEDTENDCMQTACKLHANCMRKPCPPLVSPFFPPLFRPPTPYLLLPL